MNNPYTSTGGPKRILVVHEEPMVAETMQAVLRHDHHAVETASHGQIAFAMYATGRHDVVIIAESVPGSSAVELARNIRNLEPDQAIVLTTDNKTHLEQNPAASSMFTALLQKPFAIDDLRALACLPFALA